MPHQSIFIGEICVTTVQLSVDDAHACHERQHVDLPLPGEQCRFFTRGVRGAQERSLMGTSVLSASHDAATLPMSPFLLSHFPSDEVLDTSFLDSLGVCASRLLDPPSRSDSYVTTEVFVLAG